jgi:hypothetical protein
MKMANSNSWVVTVFKGPSAIFNETIIGFYRFIDMLKEVRSFHFLIRYRVDGNVVVSFRVMVNKKAGKSLKEKIAAKLKALLPVENFAIDPSDDNSVFGKYVAWSAERIMSDRGQTKFNHFVDLLRDMSVLVIRMIENGYFDLTERVELTHVFSWMLGCTEYGMLRTSGMEVGYYDRLEDKYSSYLREVFPKSSDQKENRD